MPAVDLMKEKPMNRKISRLPGVRDAVRDTAEEIAGRATGRLAGNRRTGSAHIEITMGKTDALVSLVDPAALSIEFGHYLGPRSRGGDRTYVEGLHLFEGYRFMDGVG